MWTLSLELHAGPIDHTPLPRFDPTMRGVMEIVGTLALVAGTLGGGAAAVAQPAGVARRFWVLACLGLAYFTVDELFSLHERLGGWLFERGVPDPPGFHHLDDALVAAIGAVGLVVIGAHWRVVQGAGRAGLVFAAGVALYGAAALMDVFAPIHSSVAFYVEEGLEVAGALLAGLAGWIVSGRWLPRRAGVAESPGPGGAFHRG